MTVLDLQRALTALGLYAGAIDGSAGPVTRASVDRLLEREAVRGIDRWSAARRQLAAMQIVCRQAGLDVGEIDGLKGPQTTLALEAFAGHATAVDRSEPPEAEPKAAPPVWPRQREVERFYGAVGKNQASLALPYPMRLAWDLKRTVTRISVHEKVHDSASRVLCRVADAYPDAKRRELGLDLFGGALNVRRMRGGSAWSMHSWGIAIDFDPARNQLAWGRDRARLARADCDTFWRLWEEEGWVALGRVRNFDWMHVQAARL